MIITQTPLRISLLGGNTDYPSYFKKHGGKVLTLAIDKYVYVIVKKRFDDLIYINYSEKEKVSRVKEIKHDLVRVAMKMVGISKGIEITFLSDIPSEGSGLGSSSAVLVGLLNALHQYKGETVNTLQLVQEACMLEVDILKKPIGYQDQHAVAFGGLKKFEFGKHSRYETLDDIFSNFSDSLLLLYTGITRKSESVLGDMKLNKRILDKNKKLVDDGVSAIENNDLDGFAQILDEYWNLKKILNKKTTNSYIDKLYKKALKSGALGGKIVGAGGGGFLLLVVKPENRQTVKLVLGLKELPFNLSRDGSKVIFNIL